MEKIEHNTNHTEEQIASSVTAPDGGVFGVDEQVSFSEHNNESSSEPQKPPYFSNEDDLKL